MNDLYSDKFINFLRANDIIGIKTIPKSDLHNHFVLGGSRVKTYSINKHYR